jgi:hypothetical protein
MRRAKSISPDSLKQAGTIASNSNSPQVNLPDQPNKDTKEYGRIFRIISQHVGLPNNILANSTMKGDSTNE